MNRNNEQYMPTTYGSPLRQKRGYPYPKQMTSRQTTVRTNNFTTETNNDDTNNDTIPRPLPPVITNPAYLQGYLRTKIGKFMKVNFLLGTGTFIDKDGILKEVGVDHIVLRDIKTGEDVIGDLYSIKFVEIPD
ncbi:hypothetical protein [Vallitalea guaymasensis]|uniref:hypothetical protein n=1 Tax=Vallitalea guaymasensis TaxID=1185412 RepID=UPI000DE31C95|nr:hypothetical protein [Vallitalea guaymasensis]